MAGKNVTKQFRHGGPGALEKGVGKGVTKLFRHGFVTPGKTPFWRILLIIARRPPAVILRGTLLPIRCLHSVLIVLRSSV
ncbi:MAG TPA: hypothetical protein VMY37_20640 [Thermoguttaceae bacterium]|nr:hypothetical protein [Thermoguttaceae bacterium]